MPTTEMTTPLYDAHLRSGARMVPFAGFLMPVQYDSVIAESKAVRDRAGMFDVSHMGRLRLTGDRSPEFLEWVTTNDVAKVPNGDGQYSLLPNDDGGVVDDIILYKKSPTDFGMVVNASNHAKDVAWLQSKNTLGVEIQDDTASTAMIAVQGPAAVDILAGLASDGEALRTQDMFGSLMTEVAGVPCFAARSGYTGEDGYELVCPADRSDGLWASLVQAGVMPCGLGARDVLRVEAGLPLYGHELTDEMSPLCAGLGWVISKEKAFVGSEKMAAVRESGAPLKLVGVKLDGKRLPQPDMLVSADGDIVGRVSSGVYSPLLECGIAFAFVDPSVTFGTPCVIDMRGKEESGVVVNKRFFKRAS